MNQTILFRKSKEGEFVIDFDPEESNAIMQTMAQSLGDKVLAEIEKDYEHDGNRIKKVKVQAKDDSFTGEITHVPIDYFGEKGAEVRAVFNIRPHGQMHESALRDAINSAGFQEMKA